MNSEIVEQWQIVKDSYREAVVFFEADGLFFVGGKDIEVLRKEFSIRCGGWVGFDFGQGRAYMAELVKRGHAVVRAGGHYIREIVPPPDRRKELDRQRHKGKFLAIEPTLLFDERSLCSNQPIPIRYRPLLSDFKELLVGSDWNSIREHGELFVYAVDGFYEIDRELSTMCLSDALFLAKAAFETDSKLHCKLVQPKAWRGSRQHRVERVITTPCASPKLGQMAFDFGDT